MIRQIGNGSNQYTVKFLHARYLIDGDHVLVPREIIVNAESHEEARQLLFKEFPKTCKAVQVDPPTLLKK